MASSGGHPGVSPYYQVHYNEYFGDFNSSWDSFFAPSNGVLPYYTGSSSSFLANHPSYKNSAHWVKMSPDKYKEYLKSIGYDIREDGGQVSSSDGILGETEKIVSNAKSPEYTLVWLPGETSFLFSEWAGSWNPTEGVGVTGLYKVNFIIHVTMFKNRLMKILIGGESRSRINQLNPEYITSVSLYNNHSYIASQNLVIGNGPAILPVDSNPKSIGSTTFYIQSPGELQFKIDVYYRIFIAGNSTGPHLKVNIKLP